MDHTEDNIDVTVLKKRHFLQPLKDTPTAVEEVVLRRSMFEVKGEQQLLEDIRKATT
jgi:hypothetical protein